MAKGKVETILHCIPPLLYQTDDKETDNFSNRVPFDNAKENSVEEPMSLFLKERTI